MEKDPTIGGGQLPEERYKEYENSHELPYEETKEGFGRWFREAAKEKWEKYLGGDEKDITLEERDSMRQFLMEYGTKEEVETKLRSFGRNFLADELLRKEIKDKRPDIKLDY